MKKLIPLVLLGLLGGCNAQVTQDISAVSGAISKTANQIGLDVQTVAQDLDAGYTAFTVADLPALCNLAQAVANTGATDLAIAGVNPTTQAAKDVAAVQTIAGSSACTNPAKAPLATVAQIVAVVLAVESDFKFKSVPLVSTGG